jgi:hypothetical protein
MPHRPISSQTTTRLDRSPGFAIARDRGTSVMLCAMNGAAKRREKANGRGGHKRDVEVLRPFLGKWVALTDAGEVIASGDTVEQVTRAAAAAGAEDPLFEYLPAHRFVG